MYVRNINSSTLMVYPHFEIISITIKGGNKGHAQGIGASRSINDNIFVRRKKSASLINYIYYIQHSKTLYHIPTIKILHNYFRIHNGLILVES